MKILVIDVAAEYGGAISILNQFIEEFKENKENQYTVILSKPSYDPADNIQFINLEWVKKSHIHRLYFDEIFIHRIISKIKPDYILSLQNKAITRTNYKQVVYFHNALPISEKRFGLFESRKLWTYQNIIGYLTKKSLRKADQIIVQADWIKKALVEKWNINENIINVKRPKINSLFSDNIQRNDPHEGIILFYPANGSIYKNHRILLEACFDYWSKADDKKLLQLAITCKKDSIPRSYLSVIDKKEYPVMFLGRLSQEEMKEWYSKSVLVFPSYLETVGLPLLEAKSMKSMIVVSDCEYAHDTLKNYDNVLYFKPTSPKELSVIIDKLISSSDWRRIENE